MSALEKLSSPATILNLLRRVRSGAAKLPPAYRNYMRTRAKSLQVGRTAAFNISKARRKAGKPLSVPSKSSPMEKGLAVDKSVALRNAVANSPNMGHLKSSLGKWDKTYPLNIRTQVDKRILRDTLKQKHFPTARRPSPPITNPGPTRKDLLVDKINRKHYSY
jgi:hypothetical protein